MACSRRSGPCCLTDMFGSPAECQLLALTVQGAMNGGNGTEATALWGALEEGLSNATDAVDWYNVLLHHVPDDAAAASGLIEGAVDCMTTPCACGVCVTHERGAVANLQGNSHATLCRLILCTSQ